MLLKKNEAVHHMSPPPKQVDLRTEFPERTEDNMQRADVIF